VSERRTLQRAQVVAGAVLLVGAFASPAWAHEHEAQPAHGGEGQVLANGANHPAFNTVFESCESGVLLPGFAPAWYGLETAHHGPDSGDAGKGDGCYQADASPLGSADDQNPAIG